MAQRKVEFAVGEYYHVFNRGVDKRDIFSNKNDVQRFLQGMREFNCTDAIGSLYLNGRREDKKPSKQIVNIIAYCLNPNHFHFILEEMEDMGITRFMHRLSGGYTTYFNLLNKRSGSLFQGVFKAKHINSNEYLLHASAYVNLNNKVHKLSNLGENLVDSSWGQYVLGEQSKVPVDTDIILSQFSNQNEYKIFANNALHDMVARKREIKYMEELLESED